MDFINKKALKPKVKELDSIKLPKETTLENRGTIYISGGEFMSKDEQKKLVEDIDKVIEKYTCKTYGAHLIFTNF